MSARPRAVVVVAFGQPQLLAATLAELAPTERVHVVDNSSSTDVRAVVEQSSARYIDPGANLGFAAGVNVALRQIADDGGAPDILLLNPDARISTASIDRLQGCFEASHSADVAAAAPALFSLDGSPQQVLWPFPSPGRMWSETIGLSSPHRSAGLFAVGSVLMLRREALIDVGPFDERYFLYAEEADWQRRAESRGWRSVLVPEATAVHVGAATSTDALRREIMFHAGQETYIRRWFGPIGWISYRLAALLGASCRAALTSGARRRSARERARIYRQGPRRVAALEMADRPLRITHLVVTANAAGTERYIGDVAARQAVLGHQVTVVGGAESYLRSILPAAVTWRPGASIPQALRALRVGRGQDIVHAHLTAADLAALVATPWHGASIVSTRHIARPRGSTAAARLAARLLAPRIACEISISRYVRHAVGGTGPIVHNGVAYDDGSPSPDSRTILLAQRLEPEKATEVALAGWAASGLAFQGWTLRICGEGSQAARLRRFVAAHTIAGIRWCGWIDDIRSAMLDAAVLLASAPAEPFGLTVVQAMSLGLPVVAARGGGHLETVGRSPDALLFDPGDGLECGQLLARFAAMSTSERSAYGEQLRHVQRTHFDLDDHVRRLDRIYRSILSSPRGRRGEGREEVLPMNVCPSAGSSE